MHLALGLLRGPLHERVLDLLAVFALGRLDDLRQVGAQLVGRVGPAELVDLGRLDRLVVLGGRQCFLEAFEVFGDDDGLQEAALASLAVVLAEDLAGRHVADHEGVREEVVGRDALRGLHLEAEADHLPQLLRVKLGQRLVDALLDLRVEFLEVVGPEGRPQRGHLVDHAAQRPDVALGIIGPVVPHFRTGVVGRAGLRARHTSLGHLRDIEVAQFVAALRGAEDVGALQIAVQDVDLVEGLESAGHLDEGLPELGLIEVRGPLEMLVDLLLDVARICQLHDDAEGLRAVVEEGVAVVDDIGVGDGGEDAHLVQRVLLLLLLHLPDLHLTPTISTFFMA